ncbi:hypothetical protein TTHERM_01043140 (macronuclear) [Tetrahymena thermophila SB210]|uniref:Uncharacterized protein n=1 Tax=Tetrahymena thermophila (strain SB210) TaxID=312017 RepID=Q22CJ5_TETTS|nr:hypothetical protein TTHERM_01043140 [Tetrahymena thermophila SB210]EAR82997.1 hypothetical protein TTHERM_01043140 [Tetrahymena thermophila SB210]|eukprot:XP_001030660.1 hypothetical protein TTHERM_01043140 [Tetrahymena thermophila SB210]
MRQICYKNLLFGLLLIASIVTAESLFPHEEQIKIIDGEEYVQTPYGLMLRECVQNVPSGSYVQESEDGSVFITNDQKNFSQRLERNEKCLQKNPVKKLKDSVKIDDWLDYGDWYLPENTKLSKFESFYFVPNTPINKNDQYIYYFIGGQNNDNSGSGLSVIQPVLSYTLDGWYFQSWNCCPSGQAINTPAVKNISPHDQVYGSVEVKNSQVTIISQNKFGEQSLLTVDSNGRNFNWVTAALEVYNTTKCNDYPTGNMTYSQMNITLSDGTQAVPQWNKTANTECAGQTKIIDSKTITISHNISD